MVRERSNSLYELASGAAGAFLSQSGARIRQSEEFVRQSELARTHELSQTRQERESVIDDPLIRIHFTTNVIPWTPGSVRTGSWMGPPQGKRAPWVGPISIAVLALESVLTGSLRYSFLVGNNPPTREQSGGSVHSTPRTLNPEPWTLNPEP